MRLAEHSERPKYRTSPSLVHLNMTCRKSIALGLLIQPLRWDQHFAIYQYRKKNGENMPVSIEEVNRINVGLQQRVDSLPEILTNAGRSTT
jgi:hypothetical protein